MLLTTHCYLQRKIQLQSFQCITFKATMSQVVCTLLLASLVLPSRLL
ncbi:hypothetical protein XENTR_v10018902 [Xenopus tropicalis]|nr:hypothetical protein XENTR_v10018902 [Xenopus tropicalis]